MNKHEVPDMGIPAVRSDSTIHSRRTVIGRRPLIAAAGLLAVAAFQPAIAQTAPVGQQTVMQLKALGNSTIHGGPVSSPAIALPEIQNDDPTTGVKNQSAGIAAAPAAA